MPITKSAKKVIRASANKRSFNLIRIKAVKDAEKKIKKMVKDGSLEEAKKFLSEVYKKIDKASKMGTLKKNTASRKKSRLSAFLKKVGK